MSDAHERHYAIDGHHYMVRYVGHSHHTSFLAWEVSGYDDRGPMYGDAVTAAPEEPPMLAGEVKWDGCSNIEWPETVTCMHHECDRSGLVAIGVLLGRIYDECATLCPATIDYMQAEAQPVVVDVMPWELGRQTRDPSPTHNDSRPAED